MQLVWSIHRSLLLNACMRKPTAPNSMLLRKPASSQDAWVLVVPRENALSPESHAEPLQEMPTTPASSQLPNTCKAMQAPTPPSACLVASKGRAGSQGTGKSTGRTVGGRGGGRARGRGRGSQKSKDLSVRDQRQSATGRSLLGTSLANGLCQIPWRLDLYMAHLHVWVCWDSCNPQVIHDT